MKLGAQARAGGIDEVKAAAPRASDISTRTVLCRIPGVDDVEVRRDVPYRSADAGASTMDIYAPPGVPAMMHLPAVVIVSGYPDPGFEAAAGCRFKDLGSTMSWGRLIAASGIAAIAYTNDDPAADLGALLRNIRENGAPLGLDGSRMGLWACSGNVPVALSALMGATKALVRCAVLAYGYTLDLDGETGVAEAASAFRFANPCAGKSVEDLPANVPLFVARAGRDEMPHLNESLDRFVVHALARHLPITLANVPDAPHAFDLIDARAETCRTIDQILAFLKFNLLPARRIGVFGA